MRPEAARGLASTEEDLGHARYLRDGSRTAPASFFAQQAAEKALKAALIQNAGRFPRVHDLVVLACELKASAEILARCDLLAPACTGARYPDVRGPRRGGS